MSESFKTSFASLQHSDFFKGVGNIHLSTRLTEKSAHAAAACCLLVVGSQLGQGFSEVAFATSKKHSEIQFVVRHSVRFGGFLSKNYFSCQKQ